MSFRTLVMAFAVFALGTASAQTTRPAAGEYVGVVTGTNVYVRSAPVDGYPCTKLSYPATVKVKGEQFGWLKVVPPAQCYSLISKRYVKSDDGKIGTIAGTNVYVRAGSDLTPRRRDVIQTRLNTPDKVAILGESGEYYKIVPPEAAVLWVSSRYVRRARGATPETLPTTQPTTELVATQPTTREVTVKPPPEDEFAKALAAFKAAEAALQKEFDKPREERDVKSLLARYQAVEVPDDSPWAPFLQARIEFLSKELELEKDRQDVADLLAGVRARQAKLAADTVRIQLPTTRRVRSYAAEGLLRPSELFRGGRTGPKRYIITDPDSRLISAYVQCTTGLLDLQKFVGAYVGVIGTPKYEQQLRMYVVEAEHVVVIREAARPPVRPEPVVPIPTTLEAPKPEPKEQPRPTPEPEPKEQPKPAPATQPAPETPRTPPEPEPASSQPPTGLPMVETTTQPATGVNEEEYE